MKGCEIVLVEGKKKKREMEFESDKYPTRLNNTNKRFNGIHTTYNASKAITKNNNNNFVIITNTDGILIVK